MPLNDSVVNSSFQESSLHNGVGSSHGSPPIPVQVTSLKLRSANGAVEFFPQMKNKGFVCSSNLFCSRCRDHYKVAQTAWC